MAQQPPTASPPIDLFESYVYHAAEAAKVAQTACKEWQSLQDRITALEGQLKLAKLGQAEEQIKARNAQKQLEIVGNDQIIYCVLDGDGCIFNRDLIAKGRDGGREAAISLTKSIDRYADSLGIKGQLTIVVHLYLNKAGLSRVLHTCGIADDATFSAFLLGLNAAHPLILVSDVGPSKEACDAKLTQTLKLYAKLPSTKLVLAGAAHDGGYAHLFSSLETEAPLLFNKVTLLKSYHDLAFELKRLNLRSTSFAGLFETKKLVAGHGPSTPIAIPLGPGTAEMPKGLQPPQLAASPRKSSPAVVAAAVATAGRPTSSKPIASGAFAPPVPSVKENVDPLFTTVNSKTKLKKLRAVDPTKPLNKQAYGPPCNRHYLLPATSPFACTDAATCRYSHAYALTPPQLAMLRRDAAKSPCFTLLKGKICFDEACFAGHVCPRGEACAYGTHCRFNAPGMHPPGTRGRSDGWAWQGDLYSEPADAPSARGKRSGLAATKTGGMSKRAAAAAAGAYRARADYYSTTSSGSEGYETTSSLD